MTTVSACAIMIVNIRPAWRHESQFDINEIVFCPTARAVSYS